MNDHELVSRPAASPPIDPEHEKRLKLEETKRLKLEDELRQLKELLARKAPEPPRPAPSKPPRNCTIYHGHQKHETIVMNRARTTELDLSEPVVFPEGTAGGFHDSSSQPELVSASGQPPP